MIVKTYKKLGEGMTFDEKKLRVERSFKYSFHWLINLPLFWFVVGATFGIFSTGYVVIDALNDIDKLLVCK